MKFSTTNTRKITFLFRNLNKISDRLESIASKDFVTPHFQNRGRIKIRLIYQFISMLHRMTHQGKRMLHGNIPNLFPM